MQRLAQRRLGESGPTALDPAAGSHTMPSSAVFERAETMADVVALRKALAYALTGANTASLRRTGRLACWVADEGEAAPRDPEPWPLPDERPKVAGGGA